jgi:hypothetical protein
MVSAIQGNIIRNPAGAGIRNPECTGLNCGFHDFGMRIPHHSVYGAINVYVALYNKEYLAL